MSQDLLLEIGTEEIPARFMQPALKQLRDLAERMFGEARLEFEDLAVYGTPRRLALYVRNLVERQQDLTKETKGPAKKAAYDAEGKPTKAAQGFARSQGVEVQDLVIRDTGSGEYVFAVVKEVGRQAQEVLADILPGLITGLSFPKPMRWADKELRFVRPIHWLVALLGKKIIDFELEGLRTGRVTYGHRFLHPQPIPLAGPEEYLQNLEKGFVIADQEKRKKLILEQIKELSAAAGGVVHPDPELLEEVAFLIEYPTALCGSFKEGYLELPEEVVITPMQEHQRYFPLRDAGGKLLAKFITVRNGTGDYLDIVREGNEKVLAARLDDAHFFYREDLKEPLAAKVDQLKTIVFQEKLGTVYDKVKRIRELAGFLGQRLHWSSQMIEAAKRAALLAKSDLVTGMVYEFPELQGIMGSYYALLSGEKPEVAEGIREHYLPRFAGDALPASPAGQAVSIADKVDTIVGCFTVGLIPSGSQDPYALRRQALGICHIILERHLPLSLKDLVAKAYEQYVDRVENGRSPEVIEEVLQFFKQRMENILQEEREFNYDVVDAVLAVGWDRPDDAVKRAGAVRELMREPDFASLLTGFTRAANLAKNVGAAEVNPRYLLEEVEQELDRSLDTVRRIVQKNVETDSYLEALKAIATLREPIDDFFNGVMVMVDDEKTKNNRLALLKKVVEITFQIADLSKIVTK